MPDGTRFDGPEWTQWRESAKFFIWSLLADPPEQRKVPRTGSLISCYRHVRILVLWMIKQGFCEFTELDREAQQRFLSDLAQRKRKGRGEYIKKKTLGHFQNTMQLLFLQGLKYPPLAVAEPLPRDRVGQSDPQAAIPHTPDEIAGPLIQGALRLMKAPASDVIALHAIAQKAYDEVKVKSRAREAAIGAVANFPFSTLPGEQEPWYRRQVDSTNEIRFLVDRIVDAAFVLLSFLVGMRSSEIMGLEAKCVIRKPSLGRTEEFLFVQGKIFKTAASAQGSHHQWIAPDVIERVVHVLEQLSAHQREKSDRPHLFLTNGAGGLTGPKAKIGIMTTQTITKRLNSKLAPFIGLPAYRGKTWHLSTHQGRKTFARFVAKKDKTGLYALKKHFGHASIVMTHRAYAGVDHNLSDLLNEAAKEEMAAALTDLSTTKNLAGPAGVAISAQSSFRGEFAQGDGLDFVRTLLEDTNLRVHVCEYGYCIYNSRYSACNGDEHGPNPAYRTQSTCVGCKNFAVTLKHRPVWEERLKKYVDFLASGEVGPDIREDFEQKIAECLAVLAQLRAPITAELAGRDE